MKSETCQGSGFNSSPTRSYSLISDSGSKRKSPNDIFLKFSIIKTPVFFRDKSQLLCIFRKPTLYRPLFIGVSDFGISKKLKLFSFQKGFTNLPKLQNFSQSKKVQTLFSKSQTFYFIEKVKRFFPKLKLFILVKISNYVCKNIKTIFSEKSFRKYFKF